jgi:hypothetical protein
MRVRRRYIPVVATAIAAGAVVALLFTPASPAAGPLKLTSGIVTNPGPVNPGSTVPVGGGPVVTPAGGVHTQHFCGTQWKNVLVNHVGFNIYNNDFGARTCLVNTNNLGFGITNSSVRGGYKAFPNISSGWKWGVAPLHGYRYPVQERADGHPLTSVSVHLVNRGVYNAAYDMWFSTYAQKNGQDNAAEVMIWLACQHNCFAHWWPVVRIEGVRFYKVTWVAYHNGVHWRYTAFQAVSSRSSFRNLWLNPFFQAAHVKPTWYLTSIDFGFELVDSGYGLRVNNYSLTGVR